MSSIAPRHEGRTTAASPYLLEARARRYRCVPPFHPYSRHLLSQLCLAFAFWIAVTDSTLAQEPVVADQAAATDAGARVGSLTVQAGKQKCCSIWDFLGAGQINQAVCQPLLNSELARMLRETMLGPMAKMAGLTPSLTSPEFAEEGGVKGLAAQTEKEKADADAKIKAIRALADQDCNCYPEVVDVLLDSLNDCIEPVRFEALRALYKGCLPCKHCHPGPYDGGCPGCQCQTKVIDRLVELLEAKTDLGTPRELSPRVRQLAQAIIEQCANANLPPVELVPVPDPPPEPLPDPDIQSMTFRTTAHHQDPTSFLQFGQRGAAMLPPQASAPSRPVRWDSYHQGWARQPERFGPQDTRSEPASEEYQQLEIEFVLRTLDHPDEQIRLQALTRLRDGYRRLRHVAHADPEQFDAYCVTCRCQQRVVDRLAELLDAKRRSGVPEETSLAVRQLARTVLEQYSTIAPSTASTSRRPSMHRNPYNGLATDRTPLRGVQRSLTTRAGNSNSRQLLAPTESGQPRQAVQMPVDLPQRFPVTPTSYDQARVQNRPPWQQRTGSSADRPVYGAVALEPMAQEPYDRPAVLPDEIIDLQEVSEQTLDQRKAASPDTDSTDSSTTTRGRASRLLSGLLNPVHFWTSTDDASGDLTAPASVGYVARKPCSSPVLCDEMTSLPGRKQYNVGIQRVLMAPFTMDTIEPVTHYRLRGNAGYGLRGMDRAEYYWARIGGAKDPPRLARVDFQDLQLSSEVATGSASVITTFPLRFISADGFGATGGPGDLSIGIKSILCSGDFWKFGSIFTTYMPTGSAHRGLGTGHISLEPGFLATCRLSDISSFHSEIKYWIPLGGDQDFSSQVLQWGFGHSKVLYAEPMFMSCWDHFAIISSLEIVGWTVQGGQETVQPLVPTSTMSNGVTIVNVEPGLRLVLTEELELGMSFSHAMTGPQWHDWMMRFDVRWFY